MFIDSVKIEVERGTSTNSYIEWDESLVRWWISNTLSTVILKSENLQAEKGTFNPSGGAENEDIVFFVKNNSLEDSFTITAGGDVFANGQIRTNMPSQPTTPAILLNADRSGPGEEENVIALSVTRGGEDNSNIKWDESNDRWDFNYGLYLNGRLRSNIDMTLAQFPREADISIDANILEKEKPKTGCNNFGDFYLYDGTYIGSGNAFSGQLFNG